MGWLSKLKKTVAVVVATTPYLPIPQKYKQAVADTGKVEQDIEAVIADVKPPKPAA